MMIALSASAGARDWGFLMTFVLAQIAIAFVLGALGYLSGAVLGWIGNSISSRPIVMVALLCAPVFGMYLVHQLLYDPMTRTDSNMFQHAYFGGILFFASMIAAILRTCR